MNHPRWKLTPGLFLCVFLAGAGAVWPATAPGTNALPLPDVETVLRRVIERVARESENDANFHEHYTYTRSKRTDTKDAKGEVKKTESKTSTHDPAKYVKPKPAVKPLPSPRAMTEASVKEDPAKGRAFEKRDFNLDEEMIQRFRFTVVGREMIEGRPALMLRFEPAARDLPVKTFKDRFINKAAGTVWVDEQDAALVRADLRLTEEVSVFGGLVGSVKRCVYSFLRSRTSEGWWYTRNVSWHLEGRQFFSRRIMDYDEQRTGVQRVR